MSLATLLFVLAGVVALVGAFVNPPRVSLLAVAVALIGFGLAVGAGLHLS